MRSSTTTRVYQVGQNRSAAIAVEMLLVIPLLIVFSFGVIELGWMMYVKHRMAIAVRVGGRQASLPDVTEDEVTASTHAQLGSLSPVSTIEVSPVNVEEGQPVSVCVSIQWDSVALIGFFSFLDDVTLEEENEYLKEAG